MKKELNAASADNRQSVNNDVHKTFTALVNLWYVTNNTINCLL